MHIRLYKIGLRNGSKEIRTVHNDDLLAAIKNRLYLCSAFKTQMLNIEN